MQPGNVMYRSHDIYYVVVSSASFSPMRWNAARTIGWTNNLAWPFAVIELVSTCCALGWGTADMFTLWQPRSHRIVCSVELDVLKKSPQIYTVDCIMCAQCYIFCQAFQRVTMFTYRLLDHSTFIFIALWRRPARWTASRTNDQVASLWANALYLVARLSFVVM